MLKGRRCRLSKYYVSIINRKQFLSQLKRQSGGALIIAIFIIVIIGLLGTSLMTLQRDAAKGTLYEVYAARAYLAAYSANEVAMARLFPTTNTRVSAGSCLNNKKEIVELSKESVGFHDCEDVSYTCKSTVSKVGTVYTITSKAICQNSEVKVYRELTTKKLAFF